MGKTDSTGTYSYFCDGATPGSPVLSDSHATYTPGLSESRGGTSSYYANDRLGNLWTRDPASGKFQLTCEDFSGFGTPTSGGAAGSPFGFGGANGCQSDADTGLVLMGHRYYDTRIGRFISQDHAKSGGNWYAYCGNNPTNKTDPSGLSDGLPGSLGAPDQRYGGLGGFLDGGADNLDSFWSSENAAMERGQEGYLASVAIHNAQISGPDGYTNYVRKLLEEIAVSPIGRSLLVTAFYTKTLSIQYFHNQDSPNSYYDFNTGILLYDPALHAQVNTEFGLSDAPPVSILEHELGHDVTGLKDPDDPTAYPGCQTIFDTHGRDNIAVNENPFRSFLGLSDRIDHGASKMPNGSWFDPSW